MVIRQGFLFEDPVADAVDEGAPLRADVVRWQRFLDGFEDFGAASRRTATTGRAGGPPVPTWTNEFWTARQRDANPLHEVSYRACFKPALPRFFVARATAPGDRVHDPFGGRGTTPIEAALLGRRPSAADVNPLTGILVEPRLDPPTLDAVAARVAELDLETAAEAPDDLLVFYHPDTLRELAALRAHLLARAAAGTLDAVDRWIRMVAVNRLTGHSPGFFSVYTMPPNQAVSVATQRKLNARRKQTPPRRDVRERILAKSRSLLAGLTDELRATLAAVRTADAIRTAPAAADPAVPDGSVDLVVTSPPFLNIVDYAADNWLRCWFCGIDPETVAITRPSGLDAWERAMEAALVEARRMLAPQGLIAFEVGEVRGGTVRLEESVIDAGRRAGLTPFAVLIHVQQFTKTANCWGVDNNSKGTNSNRIVLLGH